MPIVNAKMSPDGKKKKLVWNDNGTKKLVDTSANELPSVSSNDNGKVLGVDDGEWSVVSAPSGGGTLVINLVWDIVTGGGTLNKTWREIKNAAETGKVLCCITNYDEEGEAGTIIYTIPFVNSDADGYHLQVIQYFYDDGTATNMSYIFTTQSENGYPEFTPQSSQ